MACEMVVGNEDKRALIKIKIEVGLKKKKIKLVSVMGTKTTKTMRFSTQNENKSIHNSKFRL